MWRRVKAAWLALLGHTPADDAIEVRRIVARIDISLIGNTIRTDMEVTIPALEALANGIGMTLVPMPSQERH